MMVINPIHLCIYMIAIREGGTKCVMLENKDIVQLLLFVHLRKLMHYSYLKVVGMLKDP